jgi:hypothetical protein
MYQTDRRFSLITPLRERETERKDARYCCIELPLKGK